MSKISHQIYVATLAGIVILVTLFLLFKGISYYHTGIEERFYHPDHNFLKPSGIFGHGLGILGTLLITIGVFGYIARKRYGFLSRFGRLKYWLEFHIFLCTLGPILILFHTAFKFGGIVSISFWSMVAVVISGVIGRFIYIQIPRTIEGRELNLHEIRELKNRTTEKLSTFHKARNTIFSDDIKYRATLPGKTGGNLLIRMVNHYFEDKRTLREVKKMIAQNNLSYPERKKILRLVRKELSLNNRIDRLQSMQKLFTYWHVAHLPFAIIMLVFLIIHVGIVLSFGYTWIF